MAKKTKSLKGFPKKKYSVIYADPPWRYSTGLYQDKGRPRAKVQEKYPTMQSKDIAELPVKSIAKDNSVCFMWTTDSHLESALKVMKAWGFEYKTIAFTWVKMSNKGNVLYNFSPYTLKSTEICIVGVRGTLSKVKKINNIKGLVFAERLFHSKKPDKIRDMISRWCGYKSRIELFARNKTKGWDVWGNQI
jgi:N6-adenosine-specific RNA methylase IME4